MVGPVRALQEDLTRSGRDDRAGEGDCTAGQGPRICAPPARIRIVLIADSGVGSRIAPRFTSLRKMS